MTKTIPGFQQKFSDKDQIISDPEPEISAIIPTLNEADHLGALISRIRESYPDTEIIVVDGGSTDDTEGVARESGVRFITSPVASRPAQLNIGAKAARSNLLWFIHADSLPPQNAFAQITEALKSRECFGCFRMLLNSEKRALKVNSWFTRLPVMIVRGGDQTLFMRKSFYERLNGFCEKHIVMEEYDFIRRGRKLLPFVVLQDDVLVSARKYEENSYFRVNFANLTVFALFYLGVKPPKLLNIYKRMIKHPKG